jgi:hypothetical protein
VPPWLPPVSAARVMGVVSGAAAAAKGSSVLPVLWMAVRRCPTGGFRAGRQWQRMSARGRYCQFEPGGSSRRRREPPREWSTTAAPRTAAARGLAGPRAQRLLRAALREYARRQPRSAPAARPSVVRAEGIPSPGLQTFSQTEQGRNV